MSSEILRQETSTDGAVTTQTSDENMRQHDSMNVCRKHSVERQARQAKTIAIARHLLSRLTDSTISRVTGLSAEEIHILRQSA